MSQQSRHLKTNTTRIVTTIMIEEETSFFTEENGKPKVADIVYRVVHKKDHNLYRVLGEVVTLQGVGNLIKHLLVQERGRRKE